MAGHDEKTTAIVEEVTSLSGLLAQPFPARASLLPRAKGWPPKELHDRRSLSLGLDEVGRVDSLPAHETLCNIVAEHTKERFDGMGWTLPSEEAATAQRLVNAWVE